MYNSSATVLTGDQIDHFMQYGWVTIPQCFTREQAQVWVADVWTRLGYKENDSSTWLLEKVNMPALGYTDVGDLAPKAWAAICELCGGEERIHVASRQWGDNFIVNLGREGFKGQVVEPRQLDNWHVDGDFFVHFLDSPEQALLVIPCITDVFEDGGPTYVCPDSIGVVAKHLLDHPEGVTPMMLPRGEKPYDHAMQWFCDQAANPDKCKIFHQMTGECGDVILMHPLMMHSASQNSLHVPRIITNPAVTLKKAFNFSRKDSSDYSIVERKTLRDLGVDGLPGWQITGERERIRPIREDIHAVMKDQELQRLAGIHIPPTGDTGVEVHRELVKA